MTTAAPRPAVPVDAPYRVVVEALSAAQKSTKGAPAYSRFVNRPLGRLIAAAAYKLGATPNQITGVSAVLSFSGITLLAVADPAWWTGPVIGLCLVLGYAFDAADGQLARLRGGGSAAGEWLDHMVDATKIAMLHLAVLIGLFRFSAIGTGWLLIPLGFSAVASVMFFGMILNDSLRRQFTARTGRTVERGGTSGVRSLLVIPTDYGLLCVVFALWGTSAFFPLYVVVFVANAGFMALAAVKWFRDMGQLGKDVG